jgi:4-amino-4-deoxy-L-arabinose transferase-like glycosyltransferase
MTTTTHRVTARPRLEPLVVGAAMILLGVMAAYRIGRKQLWTDEGVAVGLSHDSIGRFLYVITHWEVNQSPYYVVFRAWHVLGDDPATMRALSAVFAIATLPVLYAIGRRLYDARVGAIACVVLAVNAVVLQWSQQIRAYTMAMFLVTLATYCFLRLIDDPTTARGLLYGVVAVAAIGTHFVGGLIIVAHGVSVLVLRARPVRALAAAGAVLGVFLVPIVLFVVTAEGDPLAWVDEPGGTVFVRALSRLAGGRLPFAVALVLGAIGVVGTARGVRDDPRSREAFRLLLPVLWVVVPVTLGIAFSVLVEPLFVAKFFIGVLPGSALVVAFGITSLRPRALGAGALVVVVACSVNASLRWYRTDSREDWVRATGAVVARTRPDDAVVVLPGIGGSVAEYYARRSHDHTLRVVAPDPDDVPLTDRLWELEGPVDSDWPRTRDYPGWRDRNYELVESETFDGVVVRLYERQTR